MEYNRLIHGKSAIERIVSVEVSNDVTTLYLETPEGIETLIKPNKFWILASFQIDRGFKKLNGNLYYRWIKTYTSREQFLEDKKRYYKKDIYYINDEKEAAMLAYGFTYFKGMRIDDVSVLAFDIESTGLLHDEFAKVLLIANTFRKNGKTIRKLFAYDDYETEAQLFDAWCEWVREVNPSVMIGHNIFGFDLPYMDYCASLAGTSLRLGRDGSSIRFNEYESEFRVDGAKSYKYQRCFIHGREIIDTIFIAHKYDIGKKYENYRLKGIIAQEGLEVKDRQFYDAGQIRHKYNDPEEWKKIKAYAEQDGDDALALYDLMIPSYFYLTSYIPKTFQQIGYTASGSQINAFLVRSYLQDFHSIPKASEAVKYEGALSYGVPGVYTNVVKWDVKSMYPSIMLQYEIYDNYKDPNKNFLQMVDFFTQQRFENKRKAKETGDRYYADLDQSGKQIINSAYGMMGASGLQFNSPHNAAFVTEKGRELLRKAIKWATSREYEEWVPKDAEFTESETE